MSAVLVTGGLGVIGSLVVRHLLDEGYTPVAYELQTDKGELVRDIRSRITVIEGDVRDEGLLRETLAAHGVEYVVHTAAIVGPFLAHRDLRQTVDVNVNGTVAVIEACLAAGVRRLVYFSTKGVYDYVAGSHDHPTYAPVNEDYPKMSPPSTHSLYDATKLFGEHLLTKYRDKHGLDFAAFRFGSTWSPSKSTRGGHGTLATLGQMIDDAMLGRPTTIPVGGDQKDDFVYSKDIARAAVLALRAPELRHRFYQIATGEVHDLHEVAAILRTHYPDVQIELGPGLDFRRNNLRAAACWDIGRAREDLGYEPAYGLREGIADYIRMTLALDLLPGARPPAVAV